MVAASVRAILRAWFWRLALVILACALLPLSLARAEGNLQLSILTSAKQVIEGEMVLVTIRGVYDRKVAVQKLHLAPSDGFDWVQIAQDHWREERIDGLPWIVFERHLAVWPRRSGTLIFGPARHEMTVIDKQSQRKDVVVEAKPLALAVGAFPALKGWHFAASEVTLTDELSTDAAHLADGETVVRKVTLRALGALPEQLTPRPVVSENWLITFAAPVQRNLILTERGPLAEVVWTWQFRPHTGEPGLLEPVKLPFFNTATRALDAVEIPPLAIGYASFYTGQVPKGRILPRQMLLLGAALLAGLAVGLGLAALRLWPDRSRQRWARLRARWSPALHWQLWQARKRADLLAERRLAEALGRPAAELARLEARIFQRPSPS